MPGLDGVSTHLQRITVVGGLQQGPCRRIGPPRGAARSPPERSRAFSQLQEPRLDAVRESRNRLAGSAAHLLLQGVAQQGKQFERHTMRDSPRATFLGLVGPRVKAG